MFSDDHGDELLPNYDDIDQEGVFTNWVAGDMWLERDATNAALLVDKSQSLISEYVQNPRVFKCSSYRGSNVRTSSMNCRMNPQRENGEPSWLNGLGSNYVTFRRSHDIQKSADIFVMVEERGDTVNDGYFATDFSNTGMPDGSGASNPYFIIDYPASYHNSVGILSFADGHAEGHKWVEPTTLTSAVRPHRQHTHPNDKDVAWMQAHASQRR
jgi:prepilin-type processing-associated H-X9-DG protein